jgi:hypothetical protein
MMPRTGDRSDGALVVAFVLALGLILGVGPAAVRAQQGGAATSSAANASAAQGLTYMFTVTGHGLNAQGKANDFQMMASARVIGDQEWIQFFDPADREVESADAPQVPNKPMYYGNGAYYLMRRGIDTLTVVSPEKKKYAELPGNAAASAMFGNLLKVQLADPAISVARVQPDTMVEGLQTHHWRVTDDHTMKTSLLGISSSQHVHSTAEYYFAPELANDFNPFLESQQALALMGSKDYGAKLQAALGQMDHGVPVLFVWRTTTSDSRGQGTTILVNRVTNVTPGDVPATLFAIPAGYQKTKQDAIPAERAGLPDTLTTAAAGTPNSTPPKKSLLGKVLKAF